MQYKIVVQQLIMILSRNQIRSCYKREWENARVEIPLKYSSTFEKASYVARYLFV